MIIKMAKVDILGPKDDLIPVLELLRGKGVFQPDPELLATQEITARQGTSGLGTFERRR